MGGTAGLDSRGLRDYTGLTWTVWLDWTHKDFMAGLDSRGLYGWTGLTWTERLDSRGLYG